MSRRKKIIITISSVFGGILLTLAFLFWFFTSCTWGLFENTNPYSAVQPPIDAAQHRIEHEGVVYELNPDVQGILLLGVQQQVIDNPLVGPQADTIILITLNTKTGAVSLLPVPRDLHSTVFLQDVSGGVSHTQEDFLCNAYAYGTSPLFPERIMDGGNFTAASLSHELFDAPISRFAAVYMDAITEIVDILGGVEVNVTADFAEIAGVAAGERYLLDGEMAEQYLRQRSATLMTGNNLDRMVRQREFFFALLDTVKQRIFENPFIAFDLYDTVSPHLTTDMSFREMVYMGYAFLTADEMDLMIMEGEMVDNVYVMDEEAMKSYIIEWYYRPVETA